MKRKVILSDGLLFVAVIVVSLILSSCTIVVAFVLVNEDTVADISDLFTIRLLFTVPLIGFLVSIVASSPRYLCVLSFSTDAIVIWIPFHRSKMYSYKQFRNIYCGQYFHGNVLGIGKTIYYILISQRQYSQNELKHVNQISNSDVTVKIRFTSRNYNILKAIIPFEHVKQLENIRKYIDRSRNK